MRECTFFPLSSAGLLGWGLGEGDGQACFFFFNSWWKVDFTHHLFTLSQLCHSGIHSDNPLEAGAGPAPPWSLTSEPCRALLNGYKPQAGLQGSPHKAQCPPAHRLWAWGLLPACQGPQCSHGWGWADRVLAVTPGLCGGRDLWQGYVLDCAWTDLLDPSGSCHWLAGSFRQVPSCPSVSLFPGRHCRGGLLEAPPTRKGVNPEFARLLNGGQALCFEGPCVSVAGGGHFSPEGRPCIAFPSFEQDCPAARNPQTVSAWLCGPCCPARPGPCPRRALLQGQFLCECSEDQQKWAGSELRTTFPPLRVPPKKGALTLSVILKVLGLGCGYASTLWPEGRTEQVDKSSGCAWDKPDAAHVKDIKMTLPCGERKSLERRKLGKLPINLYLPFGDERLFLSSIGNHRRAVEQMNGVTGAVYIFHNNFIFIFL